ncbi:MAG: deoxycytidylate deaminase [Rhodothermales bacterium]|jgi:dCMP deaminase
MCLSAWDSRFMEMAVLVSSWSKDPGTKVGAVLVGERNILATGYNGFPSGIDDNPARYADREVKLAYTVHAEVNALLNAAKNGAKTEGSTLYATFHPCVNCAAAIIQGGIRRVVCPSVESAPERWHDSFNRARDLMMEAGVEIVNHGADNDRAPITRPHMPEMRSEVPGGKTLLGDRKAWRPERSCRASLSELGRRDLH